MDYEKKYKNSLEKAKGFYALCKKCGAKDTADFLEDAFSELKESEDEKIKKLIIHALHGDVLTMKETNKALAWLEKQGEQKPDDKIEPTDYNSIDPHFGKPIDKVEPKFKVGDWIVWKNKYYKVNYNGCGYELIDQNGLKTSLEYLSIDNNAHLLTIQDAKDGDVLLFEGNYNSIVLFQGIGINGKGRINYHCKCDLGNYSFGIQGDVACLGTIKKDAEHYHPATKEQRDLLFAKIKEAGYEWDVNKKELKKIEQKLAAWSDEDESFINDLLHYFNECTYLRHGVNDVIDWLESIKQRMGG